MRAGLIGPPQSGKSTLFGAITGHPVHADHTGQEHLGVVRVPDSRLDLLTDIFKPKKRTEATIEFTDVPGLSLESPAQQAEFRRHLPVLRDCDLLVAVVRDFADETVPTYRGRIDPAADVDELITELVFADLEAVTNRIEKLEKSLAKPLPAPEQELHRRELAVMQQCREALENERPISAAVETEEQAKLIRSFAFLTERPLVVVVNVDEPRAAEPCPLEHPAAKAGVALCAKTEEEIALLDPADRPAFLEDLGVSEPAGERLVHVCFQAAGLISFLTANAEEARAWPIHKGATALEAAAKVHTDIARGFIRAETVHYDDLAAAGDFKTAKAAGKVRLEGKQYVVQDGDVIQFRFNV